MTGISTRLSFSLMDEANSMLQTLGNYYIERSSYNNSNNSILDRKILQEIETIEDFYNSRTHSLKVRVSKMNTKKQKKEKLQIDWTDTADTVFPKEKIKKSDAPPVPKTIEEAVGGIFSKYFKRAVLVEMEAMKDMGVFEITTAPKGRRIINSKWVFDYKTDPEGFIEKLKARLVAVGCGQVPGIDFEETFSPVVRNKTLRFFIAMSLILGMNIHQVDINTAFLYGNLDEPNYMKMPKGFETYDKMGNENVIALKKSLYGLHQASRQWFKRLREYFLSTEFTQLKSDHCVFVKVDKGTQELIVVVVYVDDIMIACKSEKVIQSIKDQLKTTFSIKDLGEAKWMLKINIIKTSLGVWIGQSSYTEDLLKTYNFWSIPDSQMKRSPMTVSWKHDETSNPRNSKEEIKEFRTRLMKCAYLAQQTRPDITYTVNVLAQYQNNPMQSDFDALDRIFEYLRKTHDFGLHYILDSEEPILFISKNQDDKSFNITLSIANEPEAYSDASFANEQGMKSRSGYVIYAFGCLVNWYSKKQSTVSLHSTDAEINAGIDTTKEILWLRDLMMELGFKLKDPTKMKCDNKSMMAIAIDPVHHPKMKYIEVKKAFLTEQIEDMIADILTKALPIPQHEKLVRLMGLRSLNQLKQNMGKEAHAKFIVHYKK
jgi:hypothetical protein